MNTLLKEIRAINLDRKGLFDGQAELSLPNEQDCTQIDVVLTPNSGPFEGGKITFRLSIPPNFPKASPSCKVAHIAYLSKCLDKVFHPNIGNGAGGSVCFNMLGSDGWSESYTLEFYVVGLLWLLSNPNPASCMNTAAAVTDPVKFKEMAQLSMAGVPTQGEVYSIIKRGAHVKISLDTWLSFPVKQQEVHDTEFWYCPEAKPYANRIIALRGLGLEVLRLRPAMVVATGSSHQLDLPKVVVTTPGSSHQLEIPLHGGNLEPDTALSLADFTKIKQNPQDFFSCAAAEARHLPLVRRLEALGPFFITKKIDNAEAMYSVQLGGISVTGTFTASALELDFKSAKLLMNGQGAAFVNSSLVACSAMEVPKKCMTVLSKHVQLHDIVTGADGSYTIFVNYQGSRFACHALPEQGTVDIPYDLYRRFEVAKIDDRDLLQCSCRHAVRSMLDRLGDMGKTVIDCVALDRASYQMRFSLGCTGRYLVDKQQIEISVSDWVRLGKPEGPFAVTNRQLLDQLQGLTPVATNLNASARITLATRQGDSGEEAVYLVTAAAVPLDLSQLQTPGAAPWVVQREAHLLEMTTEARRVVVDPLLFQVPNFFRVEPRLFAKGEPDGTATFFQHLATSKDVRLGKLHDTVPEAAQYVFCHTVSTPEVALPPLVRAAA